MATQINGRKKGVSRRGGLMPPFVDALRFATDGGRLRSKSSLPDHVARTLRTRLGPRPVLRALETTPGSDRRARARVAALDLQLGDLRRGGVSDEARVACATERLLGAFADHLRDDLRLPAGRVEAMCQAVGFLFWFGRRHGYRSPLDINVNLVRACFGNYYIRRHRRPELSWIYYGLRGVAALGAFLVRVQWWDEATAEPLIRLSEDSGWFRDRLTSFWLVEGRGMQAWLAVADYELL